MTMTLDESRKTTPAKPPTSGLNEQEKGHLESIENLVKECELALSGSDGRISRAFAMAKGVISLRKMITDAMVREHIMPLMNSKLGFVTDRDPSRGKGKDGNPITPYGLDVVKECAIEALLRGANIVNNEFNIIAGSAYLTKNFFIRAVKSLPGVTNVVASPGVPQAVDQRTLIRFGLSWKVDGKADCLRDGKGEPGRMFEIRADKWSSADQIVGKATRKAYAAAYQQITGSELIGTDEEPDENIKPTKSVTARPVSEGQTFVPDGDAVDARATEEAEESRNMNVPTAADREALERLKAASPSSQQKTVEQSANSMNDVDAEQIKLHEVLDDATTARRCLLDMARKQNPELRRPEFESAVNKWLLSIGLSDFARTNFQQRVALYQLIVDGELKFN